MERRFKEVGHKVVKDSAYLSERLFMLNTIITEMNYLLEQVIQGDDSKLNELAKKSVELGIYSDVVGCELYVSNHIGLDELNKYKNKIIDNI